MMVSGRFQKDSHSDTTVHTQPTTTTMPALHAPLDAHHGPGKATCLNFNDLNVNGYSKDSKEKKETMWTMHI